MNCPEPLYESSLKSLSLRNRGKVRDIYDVDDQHLLIVTSDRISAFDVILPDPIPGKGCVLTAVSNFWFARTRGKIENHISDLSVADVIGGDAREQSLLDGRATVVTKLRPLPIEAVVRGYLIGSGWKDYQQTGGVCGISLPQGLLQAQQLAEPIYTPATKAEIGSHDENISFEKTVDLIGAERAEQVRSISLVLYRDAALYAAQRGIIIADTKFEFGLDRHGRLHLIDEVLTPDSSRFWPVDQYSVGISPPSFDKQYVRDYLESLDWDKKHPGPNLPEQVIARTSEKYREAEQRLVQ